ncbi:UDP-N-acetylmuramoyl-tripeptide--D-alanyl-D-alanine ligase [Pseudomonas sp. F1_0610]|uniref:UDP-N-acetylmuramoyl-tripeptide--D-alanyl-D- alanine ligase n=1 Tax=Pseudomonas sp. F1_0610 TaxID=3114284 RepID=UPI0039C03B4F
MFKSLTNSQTLATLLNAQHVGAAVDFAGVSTDSRAVSQGQMFIALKGERFDGHAYLAQVAAKGVLVALVDNVQENCPLTQIKVTDTRLALGQIGALNRQQFTGKLAAITGSSGKTTVKEMLASIMAAAVGREQVLATRGNLNNDLGVPLTLLELAESHQAAVLELGANHKGEIAYTVGLVKPHVVLINNAGTAHLGEFGGLENIVKAKGEILQGLDEQGIAVLNRDDAAFSTWQAMHGQKQLISFAKEQNSADFYAKNIHSTNQGSQFTLCGLLGEHTVSINLLGEHNVSNALAAAACAYALGFDAAAVIQGLQSMQAVKGRTLIHRFTQNRCVIDDTYNANPTSVCAAIDTLTGFAGRKLLVLGDIGELGQWAEQSHSDVGEYANNKVDRLLAVGPLMAHAVAAFSGSAQHFCDQKGLIAALSEEFTDNTTVLVKGSRSAAMEHVVHALCAANEEIH